jgi:hypothetical protein
MPQEPSSLRPYPRAPLREERAAAQTEYCSQHNRRQHPVLPAVDATNNLSTFCHHEHCCFRRIRYKHRHHPAPSQRSHCHHPHKSTAHTATSRHNSGKLFGPLQGLRDDDAIDSTTPFAVASITNQANGQVRSGRRQGPAPATTPLRTNVTTDGTLIRPAPCNPGPLFSTRAEPATIANSAYPSVSAPFDSHTNCVLLEGALAAHTTAAAARAITRLMHLPK